MPFANMEVPEAALSRAQKEEIVHRVTNLAVDDVTEAARPHTMMLIEEVKDGGSARADEVFVIPDAYRANDGSRAAVRWGDRCSPFASNPTEAR